MFKKISINMKLFGIVLIQLILSTLLLTAFAVNTIQEMANENIARYETQVIDAKKEALKNYVEMAKNILQIYKDKVVPSTTPKELEGIKADAIKALDAMTYGDDGYVFVWTYDGVPLAFNPRPDLIGKNLLNLKGGGGKFVVRDHIANAKKGGGHFYTYEWKTTKGSPYQTKISYSFGVDEWGWFVGTGEYLAKEKKEIAYKKQKLQKDTDSLIKQIIISASILVLIMAAILFYIIKKTIFIPLKKLRNGLEQFFLFIQDKTSIVNSIDLDTTDEIGIMAKEINKSVEISTSLHSELKESKLELQKRNEYINKVLNSQKNFIIISDGKHIKRANLEMLLFFGYLTLEEFYEDHGCICDMFVEEEGYLHKSHDGQIWLDIILEDRNIKHQVKMKDINGETHIFQVSTNAENIEDDFVITFTDITEVEEQSKLLQTQSKLTAIGQMSAGITHEINTPLTYIKGVTEMSKLDLEDMPDNKYKKGLLEDNQIVMDGLNRIGIIVESMREMSQVTNTTDKEKCNVYATLITVLIMIHNRSKQTSKIYINEELFSLENSNKEKYSFISNIHKQRIEQVWVVLLNNALDELVKIENYEDREIKINIFENKDEIVVEFIDNGGGISKEIIDNIFEPFVSDKDSSGIGIGLNVAKRIIDEHKGTLKVENGEKGAIFTVKLKSATN